MICSENFDMYCMLYADGELSPAELQELQAFLAANPHLEPEWNRWQQLKLSAPSIPFPHPDQLMQPGSAVISEAEAWLYIDGELSAVEKSQIDALLNTNRAANDRVQQQALLKLTPDHVACPDKASLYKKEKAPRIIAFRNIIRFAAAALIGWLLYTYFPSASKLNSTSGDVATQAKDDIRQLPSQEENPTLIDKELKPTVLAKIQPIQPNSSSSVTSSTNPALPLSEKIVANATANPNPENNPISKTDATDPIAISPAPPSAIVLENAATQLPEAKTETKTPVQSVVYEELDIQSTRETITIGTMEIREGKVRGLVRRAQALFKNKGSNPQARAEYKVLPAVQIIQN